MYGCLQFSLFHNHTIDTQVFLKAKEGWEIPKEISSYPWNVDTSIFLWYISCREIPNKISSYSWHAGSSIFISNVSLIFDAQRNDSMFVRKGKQKPKWQNMCLEKKHAPPEKWINSCGPGFPWYATGPQTDIYHQSLVGAKGGREKTRSKEKCPRLVWVRSRMWRWKFKTLKRERRVASACWWGLEPGGRLPESDIVIKRREQENLINFSYQVTSPVIRHWWCRIGWPIWLGKWGRKTAQAKGSWHVDSSNQSP